jgi:hypothetical protein
MRAILLDVGVGGLSCASGAASLNAVVSRVPGMEGVMVGLAMDRINIPFVIDATSVQATVKAISAGVV